MKSLIKKIEDYIESVDLTDISDRRFVALLNLYTEAMKYQDIDDVENPDIKAFIEAIEDSIN